MWRNRCLEFSEASALQPLGAGTVCEKFEDHGARRRKMHRKRRRGAPLLLVVARIDDLPRTYNSGRLLATEEQPAPPPGRQPVCGTKAQSLSRC